MRGEQSGPALSFTALLLVVPLLAGCRSPFEKKVNLSDELRISAVAVYPVAFRWDEPAYRSFELAFRLVGVGRAATKDTLLFFGPSEFKVFRPDDERAWAATNIVSLLPSVGVPPVRAAVLRPWIERRTFTTQKDLLDARGKTSGSSTVQETTYVGHVDVVHPSSGVVLVELTGQVAADPFAEHAEAEFDPTPEVTGLLERLTSEALAALEDVLVAPAEPKPLGFSYAFNPRQAMGYAEAGRPAFELRAATLDPVELELWLQTRVRFSNPKLPEELVGPLSRLPGGLYALDDSAKLKKGDLITAIEGLPALPTSLERTRFATVPAQAKVRRASGELAEILLP